jgi:predicted helicase
VAFDDFLALCRQSINPNLSAQAVEEMLIQHLLTERIFRTVFNNPDFTRRNAIASEIEKVIDALTSQSFSRDGFLQSLDRFYKAIDSTAKTIDDFSQKQQFLNTVYEKFFQGFSVKVADTHGIVYTPQPIVNFMVRSVEDILQKEFGKSLSSPDVHILDPFVGTGNFIVHIMQAIKKTALAQKYHNELHCNEVMLLPYYIASMNIEHEFYELTGSYEPFEGICLVDTFELAESKQISFFSTENTARVEKQKRTPLFVIIGNPPYNANQQNENDDNKNRKYKVMDRRVAETYAKDSKATNKNALSDPYVKAIRWASDKIRDTGEGIVALVTNNSFIEDRPFDGLRKDLEREFDAIYVLDLGGNVRRNPKLSGTMHNVFGIQVGLVSNS